MSEGTFRQACKYGHTQARSSLAFCKSPSIFGLYLVARSPETQVHKVMCTDCSLDDKESSKEKQHKQIYFLAYTLDKLMLLKIFCSLNHKVWITAKQQMRFKWNAFVRITITLVKLSKQTLKKSLEHISLTTSALL